MPGYSPRQTSTAQSTKAAGDKPGWASLWGAFDNSSAKEQLAGKDVANPEGDSLLQCIARPFETSSTRGDLMWALARELGGKPNATFEEGLAWAQAQGVSSGDRPGDGVSRAEAAVMVTRALKLPLDLPEGQIAYFTDVDSGAWYFSAAHAARRYGLFAGNNNLFSGSELLTAEHAKLVLNRAKSPKLLTPEQQSPGVAPILEPDSLKRILAKDELSYEEISKARDKVGEQDPTQQGELYRQIAAKVTYRNQRDNAGKYAKKDAKALGTNYGGDVMCNVTSLAMALNQLGLGVDESSAQFEDLLDEMMTEKKLGSRYEQRGQAGVAKKIGASTERIQTPAFKNGDAAKAWFEKNALPKLEAGASATMSIAFGAKRIDYHIVRLEWVEGEGLRVDDPYGEIFKKKAGWYTYDKNDVSSSEGDGAKGEDSLWSWDTVSAINRGRYVQFYTRDDAA